MSAMTSKEQLAREAYERWHQGGPAFDSITARQWCSGYMSAMVDGRRPAVETLIDSPDSLLKGWDGYGWKDGVYIDDLQAYFDQQRGST